MSLYGRADTTAATIQTELLHRRLGVARHAVAGSHSAERSSDDCLIPDFLVRTLTSEGAISQVRSSCPTLLEHLPIDLVVTHPDARLHGDSVRCRLWSGPIPVGGVVKLADHLFLSSPEFLLAQLARGRSLLELAFIASGLCGAYCWGDEGLPKRRPLTTIEEISMYLNCIERECERTAIRRLDGLTRAVRALAFAIACARSSEEIACGMLLGLPTRLGGFDLGMPLSNPSIMIPIATPEGERLVERFPDLFWRDRKLIVEYDSDAFHMTGRRRGRDANRVIEFRAAGFTVMPITTSQLFSYDLLENAARQIIADTGMPRQLKNFDANRLRFRPLRMGTHRLLTGLCHNGLI